MAKANAPKVRSRLRQCAMCGKVFNSIWNYTICERCRAKISDKEDQIREFVMHNCNATVVEIAEEFEVPVAFIRRMIEEGKLELKKSELTRCHACGVEIATGNYCKKCLEKMKHQIELAKAKILENIQKKSQLGGTTSKRVTADKVREDFRRR